MRIHTIHVTKSVTKQVDQYEPVRVEITLQAQLDEGDDFNKCAGQAMKAVDAAIAKGFGGKMPAGPSSATVETTEADAEEEVAKAPSKGRGRGRPKGSKNKAKPAAEPVEVPEDDDDEDETDDVVGSDADIVEHDDDDDVEHPTVSPEHLLAVTQRAAQILKPGPVKKIIHSFKVDKINALRPDQQMAYLNKLAAACKKAGKALDITGEAF